MNKDKTTQIFLDLVRIDSPSGEEDEVRSYIKSRLDSKGIKSRTDKAGNLYARVKGKGEPVILCAHMDTVQPGRGVEPVIRKGVIRSSGTTILGADNKSAVASILAALETVEEEKRRDLELVFSVREETDGGINEFDFKQIKARKGVIADRASAIGSVVAASPWIENIRIEVKGVAAHAGMPEKGVNALSIAAKAISKKKWGRVDNKTTANIGIIEGGSAMNTVPEKVILTGEVRSFSEQRLEKTVSTIEAVFMQTAFKAGAELIFKRENYCTGYVYKENDQVIKDLVKIFEKLKINTFFEVSFGGSDANSFVKHGIRVVNIGDGGKDPHSVKEEVSIKALTELTRFFVSYITLT